MTRIGSPKCSRPPASRPSQRLPVSIRKPLPLHGRSVSVRRGAAGALLEFLDYVLRLALLFDKPEVCGYSLTTTSTSYSTCPGATAKRFGSERVSSHSLFESRNRTPQVLLPHSHRKPAVVRPLLIHWALRSLRSRARPRCTRCVFRARRRIPVTRPLAQAYRAPLAFIATDQPRRCGLISARMTAIARAITASIR